MVICSQGWEAQYGTATNKYSCSPLSIWLCFWMPMATLSEYWSFCLKTAIFRHWHFWLIMLNSHSVNVTSRCVIYMYFHAVKRMWLLFADCKWLANSLYPWIQRCLWYMAVIPWSITAIYHDHSVRTGQTVDFLVYSTSIAFDLWACHSTSVILSDWPNTVGTGF